MSNVIDIKRKLAKAKLITEILDSMAGKDKLVLCDKQIIVDKINEFKRIYS